MHREYAAAHRCCSEIPSQATSTDVADASETLWTCRWQFFILPAILRYWTPALSRARVSRMATRKFVVYALLAISTLVNGSAIFADQFRMKTSVYQEGRREPLSINWTVFSEQGIYDFRYDDKQPKPSEITIYEPVTGGFQLLDVRQRIQTAISKHDLMVFIARLKAQATDPAQTHLALFVNPEITVTADEDSGSEFTVASEKLTYHAKGIAPKLPAMVATYRGYADKTSQLNTTRGRLPTVFIRARVNQELATRQLIPDTITLKLLATRDGKSVPLIYRSRHDTAVELSGEDQKRLQSAKQYLQEFRKVSFAEYNDLAAEVASRQSK